VKPCCQSRHIHSGSSLPSGSLCWCLQYPDGPQHQHSRITSCVNQCVASLQLSSRAEDLSGQIQIVRYQSNCWRGHKRPNDTPAVRKAGLRGMQPLDLILPGPLSDHRTYIPYHSQRHNRTMRCCVIYSSKFTKLLTAPEGCQTMHTICPVQQDIQAADTCITTTLPQTAGKKR